MTKVVRIHAYGAADELKIEDDEIGAPGPGEVLLDQKGMALHFADTMLGKVLDALEKGPNADNTIVVLWSDHGWHLGSKQHWQKFTAWRAVTRVPLMVRFPKN